MLRLPHSLLLVVSLLPSLGACVVEGAEPDEHAGGAIDVEEAPTSDLDPPSAEPAAEPDEAGAATPAPGPAPAPADDAMATLVFDAGQVPFEAADPVFFEGGFPADYTGTMLTDWAIGEASGAVDEFLLTFEHTGLALVDVAVGHSDVDIAIDVYDLDGNLLLTVDAEGPGGLESVEFDATPATEDVVIAIRDAGGAPGRYVVVVDAAE